MSQLSMKIQPLYHPEAAHSVRHWENFRHAAGLPESSPHALTDDPEEADAILVFDPENDPYSRWLRQHPVIRKYPEKCFSYSELDRPFPYLPGIHLSASRTGFLRERIQTYAYISYGPSEPLRNPFIACRPDAPKRFLFSFIGRATHRSRVRLLNRRFGRSDVHLECPDYQHWDANRNDRHRAQQRHYVTVAQESCFAICPRGDGLGSIRLFEMMEMGISPVILSDGWLLPEGPDWDRFAVFVEESRVDELEVILEPLRGESARRGQLAREAWLNWFAPEKQFDRMAEIISTIKARRRWPERRVRLLYKAALVHPLMRHLKIQLAVFLDRTGIKKFR
jgi:hypothetical protein